MGRFKSFLILENPIMLNILSWNVRGVQRLNFENSLHYIIAMYNLDLLFLIDTKLFVDKTMPIISKFGHEGYHVID